jgi:hypothetical protein
MATNALPHEDRQAQLQLLVLGIAVALSAVAVAWLLVHDRSGDRSFAGTAPQLVTTAQLQSLAHASSTPIYWAGPRPGYAYELTETASGRVFVRYLPKGVVAGDRRASFLTVGTYPDARGFASLERAAARADTNSVRLPHEGIAVIYKRAPTSVYVGQRGRDVQVEIYDPLPENARTLGLSGDVVPVG